MGCAVFTVPEDMRKWYPLRPLVGRWWIALTWYKYTLLIGWFEV